MEENYKDNYQRVKVTYRGIISKIYEVDTEGNIFKKGKKVVPFNKDHIMLEEDNFKAEDTKYLITTVFRLVASAFVENDDIENKVEVHHKNSNHKDNRACNLIWLTPEEHRKVHGQESKGFRVYRRKDNEFLGVFYGYGTLARLVDCNKTVFRNKALKSQVFEIKKYRIEQL